MTPRTTPWPHGAPCWPTLATGNEARAREFYGRVLGWEFEDAGPRQHDWVLATHGGGVVAGIGGVRTDGSSDWLLGFAVEDLDAATAAVVNANGQLLQPAHDVLFGAARTAVGRDPGGMRFALVSAGGFTGVQVVNAPGALLWEDGVADDPDAVRAFYTEVLGWEFTPEPLAGADYAMFGPAGDSPPWGGLGGNPSGLPPYWCLWFGVESVDAAIDAAVGVGGGVLSGPQDGPWGRTARLQDPDGAVFGVMTPVWDDLPDRSA